MKTYLKSKQVVCLRTEQIEQNLKTLMLGFAFIFFIYKCV